MRKNYFMLNLRQFDDASTVINLTTSNTSGNDLSTQLRTYYDRELLENADAQKVHDQFAMKRSIPKNGGQTISWRRMDRLAAATTPLTEGTTPIGSKLNMTEIKATLKQYGAYYMLSDWLQLTAPDAILTEAVDNLGENAGQTLDILAREALMLGTNVVYGDGSVTVRSGVTSDMKPSLDGYKNCVRILKRHNAPRFENNTYVAIIHPDTWYDVATEIEDIYKYTETGTAKIFKGELATYQGIRFVESTNAKIFAKAGATNAGDNLAQDVYADVVLGKNAFGASNIAGGGIETIVKQLGSSGTEDPLNQRATVGWKGNYAAKIVSELFMVRYEHATSTNEHEAN